MPGPISSTPQPETNACYQPESPTSDSVCPKRRFCDRSCQRRSCPREHWKRRERRSDDFALIAHFAQGSDARFSSLTCTGRGCGVASRSTATIIRGAPALSRTERKLASATHHIVRLQPELVAGKLPPQRKLCAARLLSREDPLDRSNRIRLTERNISTVRTVHLHTATLQRETHFSCARASHES